MPNFEFSDEEKQLIDTAREFARKAMAPKAHDADEAAKLPDGFLDQAWELGLAVAAIPVALCWWP